MAKYVAPSIRETAFNCPRCGAFAHQTWYKLRAAVIDGDSFIPDIVYHNENVFDRIEGNFNPSFHGDIIDDLMVRQAGLPCFSNNTDLRDTFKGVNNLNMALCFNCRSFSVWMPEHLLFPSPSSAAPPNEDLPDDIKKGLS